MKIGNDFTKIGVFHVVVGPAVGNQESSVTQTSLVGWGNGKEVSKVLGLRVTFLK